MRLFARPPPSPVSSLAFRPWTLVLHMMRPSYWGVGPCGCSCFLPFGITFSLASSAQPLRSLRKLPGSLSHPPSSLLSCPSPLSFPPTYLPSSPFPFSFRFCPRPHPCSSQRFLPRAMRPGSPLGTKSSQKRRVLQPKLLATYKRHHMSSEMKSREERLILLCFYPDVADSRPLLPPLFPFRFPAPVSAAVPVLAPVPVFVPVPVPVPVSAAALVCVLNPVPVPAPVLDYLSPHEVRVCVYLPNCT